jgi:hypothetical protein
MPKAASSKSKQSHAKSTAIKKPAAVIAKAKKTKQESIMKYVHTGKYFFSVVGKCVV